MGGVRHHVIQKIQEQRKQYEASSQVPAPPVVVGTPVVPPSVVVAMPVDVPPAPPVVAVVEAVPQMEPEAVVSMKPVELGLRGFREETLPVATTMLRTQWAEPKPLPEVCPVKLQQPRKSALKRSKTVDYVVKEVTEAGKAIVEKVALSELKDMFPGFPGGNTSGSNDSVNVPTLEAAMVAFPVTCALQEMNEQEELRRSEEKERSAKRQKTSEKPDRKKSVHISNAPPQTTTIPANEPKRLYRISGVVEMTPFDPLFGASSEEERPVTSTD